MPKDPSLHLEISYLEASRRVSCNLYNHLAWLITDASPELGEDGRVKVSPRQQEQVLNLAQDVCHAVSKISTLEQLCTSSRKPEASRPCHSLIDLVTASAMMMHRDILHQWQSQLKSRQQRMEPSYQQTSRLDDSHSVHLITSTSKNTQKMDERCMAQHMSYSSTRIRMKTPHQ